jgi:hypothetical protein
MRSGIVTCRVGAAAWTEGQKTAMVESAAMDLFDHALQQRMVREAPLAARLRPRKLGEFVGQEHIVGPDRLLRRAIEADRLFSYRRGNCGISS